MWSYFRLRLLQRVLVDLIGLLVSWFIVWFVVACLVRALAPDPATQLAGPLTDEATRARFAKEFGLNRPLIIEAGARAFRMLLGDWGISWRTRQPVTEAVIGPSTLTIGLALISTIISVAIALVITAAQRFRPRGRPNTPAWLNLSVLFLFISAIPAFITGLWLTQSDLPPMLGLPRQGFHSAGVPLWQTLILPSICLALPGLGLALPRLLAARNTIVRSAWYTNSIALGLSPRQILIRQGWPFLAAAVGDAVVQILIISVTGAVAVEHVFSLPGLGTVLVDAVQLGDLPVILGVVAVTTLLTYVSLALRALFTRGLPTLLRPVSVLLTFKTG
jgi:ABC-type dipeptide/oligopeptide/nickel transport system permease component